MMNQYLKLLIFLFIIIHRFHILHAQQSREKELMISLFNNATSLPFGGRLGILHAPLHPGISAGISTQINQNQTNQLLLRIKFAYLYQQYVQHGLQFYPELGYRFAFKNGIGIGPNLGLGYMHAITDLQQFELNNQGEYEKVTNFGIPSFMASMGIEFSYNLQRSTNIPLRVFTQYQMWFQTPFIRSYVPVLPNTALHLGCSFYLNKNAK